MGSTSNDLTTEDPDDYIFVSNKNYHRKQVVQSPSSHQGQPGGVGPMALTLGSHSRQTVDFGPQLCFTHALASVAMI